jgi:hypothetical protein
MTNIFWQRQLTEGLADMNLSLDQGQQHELLAFFSASQEVESGIQPDGSAG